MSHSLERRTSDKALVRLVSFLDTRCWRTFWKLRSLYSVKLGRMPSRDWVLSELLIDPQRGSELLAEVARMEHVPVPAKHKPHGNRYRRCPDPNENYPPGEEHDDWGEYMHGTRVKRDDYVKSLQRRRKEWEQENQR